MFKITKSVIEGINSYKNKIRWKIMIDEKSYIFMIENYSYGNRNLMDELNSRLNMVEEIVWIRR